MFNDVVQLRVRLALTMPHRQLAVHQRAIHGDLERASSTGVLLRCDMNFVAKLRGEEGGKRGSEAGVASPASELDVHSDDHREESSDADHGRAAKVCGDAKPSWCRRKCVWNKFYSVNYTVYILLLLCMRKRYLVEVSKYAILAWCAAAAPRAKLPHARPLPYRRRSRCLSAAWQRAR